MEWIPHGESVSQSSLLTGEGFYPLTSLDITGLNAPPDGVILLRLDLIVSVQTFSNDEIWNQTSAFSTQLRGGRFIVYGREGLGEEYFINRPQTRVRNLLLFDADFEESVDGEVGSGDIEVIVDPSALGCRYCERIYYGLEPTVEARVRVAASYMILYNESNRYRFQLMRP